MTKQYNEAKLKAVLHEVCRRANHDGVNLETIVRTLEHHAWWAGYITEHGATVYPAIKAEVA
jgi:hypothetical protein